MDRMYEVIKRHLVTEKTTMLDSGSAPVYSFEVLKDSSKTEIRNAVEKLFDVNVIKINTMIMPGKAARVGKYTKKTSSWKKAIITLENEQRIAMFDNI